MLQVLFDNGSEKNSSISKLVVDVRVENGLKIKLIKPCTPQDTTT